MSCGFKPLYKNSNRNDIFQEIEIKTPNNKFGFFIKEALAGKAQYGQSGSFIIQINPTVTSSYSAITKENEITRYSVTMKADYELIEKNSHSIYLKGKETATSDYSAALTYTGFATEVAKKDTYRRLAEAIAEKINTQIIIKFR